MLGVLIIPTGIGAELGGHCGDGNPVCKLFASCCDKLITHPNVVNASDINEMPHNVLYVEGSILDRFLYGNINLKESKNNKILVVANPPLRNDTINAVSASRVTLGADIEILELSTPLKMLATMENGVASGEVQGYKELVEDLRFVETSFDVVAIHTPIDITVERAKHYYRHGGTNPWGGVEALASKLIYAETCEKFRLQIGVQIAHAPLEENGYDDRDLGDIVMTDVLDPRMAPEAISCCYFHSVLKGLHNAPLPCCPKDTPNSISYRDVDFMVSPAGCFGDPHEYCHDWDIPVIMVKENQTVLNDKLPEEFIIVENYWEAAGIVMAIKSGIDPRSVRRPFAETVVHRCTKK